MAIIETTALTKTYGRHRQAVDEVSLRVEEGEIYGLLGRNGAGKSTIMGMLLGLIQPTSGTIRICGVDPSKDDSWRGQIGSLFEAPAFHPHLTGRQNLEVLALYGEVPRARIQPTLERVGLAEAADRKVRTYSLGMKQRLGIAGAIMGEPRLIILDEPTNGLDPQSVREVRDLLVDLRAAGHVVVLSSHILAEVEQVVDRVGIMVNGRLIRQGTLSDLADEQGDSRVIVRLDEAQTATARAVLGRLPEVNAVEADGPDLLRITFRGAADTGAVGRALTDSQVTVAELYTQRVSLEDAFLQITGDQTQGDHQ